jgi:hypothetical protein
MPYILPQIKKIGKKKNCQEFDVFNERIVTGGETASFATTLTRRIYGAFGAIK